MRKNVWCTWSRKCRVYFMEVLKREIWFCSSIIVFGTNLRCCSSGLKILKDVALFEPILRDNHPLWKNPWSSVRAFTWDNLKASKVRPGYLYGNLEKIPNSTVLLVSWIDGNSVKLFSAHYIRQWKTDNFIKNLKGPRLTPENEIITRIPFGEQTRRMLLIRLIIKA